MQKEVNALRAPLLALGVSHGRPPPLVSFGLPFEQNIANVNYIQLPLGFFQAFWASGRLWGLREYRIVVALAPGNLYGLKPMVTLPSAFKIL